MSLRKKMSCPRHLLTANLWNYKCFCFRNSLLLTFFAFTTFLSVVLFLSLIGMVSITATPIDDKESVKMRMRGYHPLGDFDKTFDGSRISNDLDDHGKEKSDDKTINDTNNTFCQARKLSPNTDINNGQKLILVWNMFQIFNYYGFNRDEFDFAGICGTSNCRTSSDRAHFLKADSVIFSAKEVQTWRNFPVDDRVKRSRFTGYPQQAHENQIFVWFHIEAPIRYRSLPWNIYNRIFNLTYTYISDPGTDIHVDYGRILPRRPDDRYVMPNASILAQKTKLVAWVVSNCHPANLRAVYVTRLKRRVNVDVYGKCGDKTTNCSFKKDGCFNEIARQYKFYLAFENSHCTEYVTEKMYRTLSMDMVPVVMGGADYRGMFPPHSFIDVRDFRSPKHLSHHLKALDRDDDAYLAYFAWKENFISDNIHDAPHNLGLCTLCEILHNPDYEYKSPCFDYKSYYSPEKYCVSRAAERKLLGI